MNWEDDCYLLSKRKFRENANIINIFTEKKGRIDGIVYGGNSRKIRNYLQISNKLFVSHSSKGENKIGYFKTELIKPISPIYFNDKERISALISICSLDAVIIALLSCENLIALSIKFLSAIENIDTSTSN